MSEKKLLDFRHLGSQTIHAGDDFDSIEDYHAALDRQLVQDRTLKDGVWLSDGTEFFQVPRQFVERILKAVPELRLSFEHLGGAHVGGKDERR